MTLKTMARGLVKSKQIMPVIKGGNTTIGSDRGVENPACSETMPL